jgi:protein phosphatase
MGGAACGDVASALVGEVVRQVFEEAGIAWLAEAGSPLGHRGEALLVASVGQANERIRLAAQADPNKVGMGSTFAGALFGGDRVVLAHVGDSRIYRLRGRHLELLTHDHLVVNELVNAGVLSRDEAGKSEYRNMLSRAVGTENVLEVETRVEELARDDLYLICSDGLHGVVQDGAISKILLEQRDLTKAVEELIRCANGAGGPDNITALLIRIG